MDQNGLLAEGHLYNDAPEQEAGEATGAISDVTTSLAAATCLRNLDPYNAHKVNAPTSSFHSGASCVYGSIPWR